MSRSVLLALAAGAVGIIIGRALPRGAPTPGPNGSPVSLPLVTTPADCKATRAELVSMRAHLALCMAVRAPPSEPDPASPAPTPSASAPPLEGMALLASEARRLHERHEGYPEAVFVRRHDGTTGVYRPDEWPADSEDIYAKKLPNGYIVWYAGPDAGPRSDPAAWVDLRDLAGPDGTLPAMGRTRIRFLKPDAGP